MAEIDKVAIDVGIVFVHPPVPREPVRVQRMQQYDLAVARRALRQTLAHQSGLYARAEITFDAMRRRDQEQRLLGLTRADDRGVKEERFTVAAACLGVDASDDVDIGLFAGRDKIVPADAIVGRKIFCRVQPHDLYFSAACGIGYVTLRRIGRVAWPRDRRSGGSSHT